jgi:A/G-specific adenine glycosylase
MMRKLVVWFNSKNRNLPWRMNQDPYRIWVSEIMLQQTQVVTVIPYFERWMKRFPTVDALAAASQDEVNQLWAGLGYYSRARNLKKGALWVAAYIQENGKFPMKRDEWLQVPGVGDYTAGAICSIAFNQPEPIVDGNVVRVVSRIKANSEILDAKRTFIWKIAKSWVNKAHQQGLDPKDFNQAMMELGATVCRPKNPVCAECPVRSACKGKKNPQLYPAPKKKVTKIHLQESKWVLLKNKKVLLIQNQGTRWREGLWDLPDAGSLDFPKSKSGMRLISKFQLRYVVTRHQVERHHTVWEMSGPLADTQKSAHQKSGQWFKLSDLPALPAPTQKALDRVTELAD